VRQFSSQSNRSSLVNELTEPDSRQDSDLSDDAASLKKVSPEPVRTTKTLMAFKQNKPLTNLLYLSSGGVKKTIQSTHQIKQFNFDVIITAKVLFYKRYVK